MNATGAPVCFARRRQAGAADIAPVAIEVFGLAPDVATALADSLPFLVCGEESAVHAFGRRLAGVGNDSERDALDAITADEKRHAAWLGALTAALPVPTARPDTSAMTAFFSGLLTRDPALHFARVAALDLAVCAILRPLAEPLGPLGAAPEVATGMRSIRRDEARHVRIARDCARRLGQSADAQHALDRSMRSQLGALLHPVQASLARLGFTGFEARYDLSMANGL